MWGLRHRFERRPCARGPASGNRGRGWAFEVRFRNVAFSMILVLIRTDFEDERMHGARSFEAL